MVVRDVDARPPVLEPDVVAGIDQDLDQVALRRRAEDVGPHPGPVHEQDRAPARRTVAGDVVEVATEAVAGGERDDCGLQPLSPLPRRPSCIDLPELPGEERAEACDRVDPPCGTGPEGGHLAGEVQGVDVQDPEPTISARLSSSASTWPRSSLVKSVEVSDQTLSRPGSSSTTLNPLKVSG